MNPNHEAASSMNDHATEVWDRYIENSGFTKFLVIAHSAGGGCLTAIQKKYGENFYIDVESIAYTDSEIISKDELEND